MDFSRNTHPKNPRQTPSRRQSGGASASTKNTSPKKKNTPPSRTDTKYFEQQKSQVHGYKESAKTSASCENEEFLVAADLNLYSNPINSYCSKEIKSSSTEVKKEKSSEEKAIDNELGGFFNPLRLLER